MTLQCAWNKYVYPQLALVVYVMYIESIAVFRNVGIGVDVHVHRISNRLGWVKTAKGTPEDTREASNSHLNVRACSGNVKRGVLLPY